MTTLKLTLTFTLCVTGLASGPAIAQQANVPGVSPEAIRPNIDGPRVIEGIDSVFIEELTWFEVRDALRAGKTTVIIATGGVEQNGPYIPTGKHNYILRQTTEAIARKLGNALVAPIIPFVPEGDIDTQTGHMPYPGTISVREETFVALLQDIANSFRVHGFRNICFIGDSGGNQTGMRKAAKELSEAWRGKTAEAHFIAAYYDLERVSQWVEEQGFEEEDEGLHDALDTEAQLMTLDLVLVRFAQRKKAGNASINGVPIDPPGPIIELGWGIINHQADVTADAIRKVIAASGG